MAFEHKIESPTLSSSSKLFISTSGLALKKIELPVKVFERNIEKRATH